MMRDKAMDLFANDIYWAQAILAVGLDMIGEEERDAAIRAPGLGSRPRKRLRM